ncbi:MAG: radical SAM protein [Pseudomonadota bacterium]
MQRTAVLVHLNALVRVSPLVGGYLKAYALSHETVRQHWDIQLYSAYYHVPASQILGDILARRPDVIGFSVYSWNVGLVLRLLRTLRGLLPRHVQFILGGVEVMRCAERYLDPTWENVAVCNGEGEATFRDYLLEVTTGDLALERVDGLSFARDGQWHSTAPRPRLAKLAQIPSPFLAGYFEAEDLAEVALFETNRGCPFACDFCYWGGAVGERVHKLELDRIKEEMTYLARHRSKTLALCDANFGMLPRDVEIAEHIAKLRHDYNAPQRVAYSTAKNNPNRVEQVARILTQGKLLHNQSISLQTLNEAALRKASRDNIRAETYVGLQRRLNEWRVPSFVELLWPMPGETLASFKDGIDALCAMGTQSFTVYPLLWLNNVGYADKTEEYGVVTLREDDPASGGQVVIQTAEVTFDEYVHGLLFAMAVYLLHNCRGMFATLLVLRHLGVAKPRKVFDDFVAFMDARCAALEGGAGEKGDAVVRLWQDGRGRFEQMISYVWRGAIAYAALHSARADFDKLLEAFVDAHWSDWTADLGEDDRELLRSAFEFDLLSRPFPFLQTRFELGVSCTALKVARKRRGHWVAQSDFDLPRIVNAFRARGEASAEDLLRAPRDISINHRPRQVSQLPAKQEEEHHWHMHQAIREIGNLEPEVSSDGAVQAVSAQV